LVERDWPPQSIFIWKRNKNEKKFCLKNFVAKNIDTKICKIFFSSICFSLTPLNVISDNPRALSSYNLSTQSISNVNIKQNKKRNHSLIIHCVKNHSVEIQNGELEISGWWLHQKYLWPFYQWRQGLWGPPKC
jgi:hypothetical protein